MIITCPNCRTKFRINPASLGPGGRSVRCSSCAHRWFVEPFTEAPAGPAAAAVAPEEPAEPAAAPQRHRAKVHPAPVEGPPPEPTPLDSAPPTPAGGAGAPAAAGGGLAGWLLVALLVLLLAAAVLARDLVVEAFPAAQPVYERLGLDVTLRLGLEFRDLTSSRRAPGGDVVVAGAIHNASDREVRVPQLRVALLDERRDELRSVLVDPPQPVLPPGGSARFELDLPDPPPEAKDFAISFADRP